MMTNIRVVAFGFSLLGLTLSQVGCGGLAEDDLASIRQAVRVPLDIRPYGVSIYDPIPHSHNNWMVFYTYPDLASDVVSGHHLGGGGHTQFSSSIPTITTYGPSIDSWDPQVQDTYVVRLLVPSQIPFAIDALRLSGYFITAAIIEAEFNSTGNYELKYSP